ncbi:MAG: hypothetical protein ACRDKX_06355 [Solirubrobacterales bacterium]
MDKDSVDRIRSATFPIARRGYEKRDVERYLNQLADWLETGGGDEARSDAVRRELERIGEQTGGILTEAHDAAEGIRAQTERDVRQQLSDANVKAESMRSSAEEYALQTREDADAYALKTRSDADAYAERVRIEADGYGEETRADAEGYAGRIREQSEGEGAKVVEAARTEAAKLVEEGSRRKADVEAVISDLERRRDTIVGELERLATEVAGTATQHRPEAVAAVSGEPEDADEAEATGGSEAAATTPGPKSKRVTATRAK